MLHLKLEATIGDKVLYTQYIWWPIILENWDVMHIVGFGEWMILSVHCFIIHMIICSVGVH